MHIEHKQRYHHEADHSGPQECLAIDIKFLMSLIFPFLHLYECPTEPIANLSVLINNK